MAMGGRVQGVFMKRLIAIAGFAASMLLPLAGAAQAGPATDAMSVCVQKSATPQDHAVVARWFFSMMSRSPSVASLSTISDARLEGVNKQTAALFTRLLTTDCAGEAKAAYAEGGQNAIQQSWQSLTFVVMQETMSGPDVQSAGAAFAGYVDQAKVGAALSK